MSMKLKIDKPFSQLTVDYLRTRDRMTELEDNKRRFPENYGQDWEVIGDGKTVEDSGSESEPEPVEIESYEDLTEEELKAEIAVRNEHRPDDEKLSTEGSIEELVARLEQDDDEYEVVEA